MHEVIAEVAGNLIPVDVSVSAGEAIPVEVGGGSGGGGGGLSNAAKDALLQIARKVVYVDAGGATYYNALYEALYPLASISAVYTQSGTVYDTDTLDSLKADLVVTATYGDGGTATVPAADYTLSGTLAVGTSTITVTYQGKTATFTVTVSSAPVTLSYIEATYVQGAMVIYDTDPLTKLQQGLTVTAYYSDTTSAEITAGSYTLSGTLTPGTSTITVTYQGKTDTFTVTVTANTVASISAVYTQSGTVYSIDDLESLKADLVVTATYADSSTETVPSADYTLSGSLSAGTSTITATYESKTTTFTVVVTDYYKWSYSYANGDLIKLKTASAWDSTHGLYYGVTTSTTRRSFVLPYGIRPYKDSQNNYENTGNYPIPIPPTATKVTIAITPNTQYFGPAFYTFSANEYTRTSDDGWKLASYTKTFAAGTYDFLTISAKYNSGGSAYQTEPTDLTILFE